MSSRWSDYFLTHQFSEFWSERLAQADASVCLIVAIGFDPRCRTALKHILAVAPPERVSFIGLRLRSSVDSLESTRLANESGDQNLQALSSSGATAVAIGDVQLQDAMGFPSGGRTALNFVAARMEALRKFRHVVVDISGMPRSIFYPLISFLCSRADQGLVQNLHVVVSDSAQLDAKIHLSEFGDADYMHTFRLAGKKKLVWLPVIASRERDRILKIFNQLKDDCVEICPVLSFPADPLRKPDDVLIDNNDVLFKELAVSSANLLLCDEQNPFDIYRKILGLHDYYVDKLSILVGEITTVVSPLSSRLLSLGALLAAIERKLPVSYVEAGTYNLDPDTMQLYQNIDLKPIEIWLTGEPYKTD